MRIKNIAVFLSFFFLSLCPLKAQVPEGIPTEGLQAFWTFSGNANDVSGKNRHGKVYGASLTEDRFGNKKHAYNFNGVSDYISTTYEGILGSNPRTVSFWAIVNHPTKPITAVGWGETSYYPESGRRFCCTFNYGAQGITMDVSDAALTFEPNDLIYDGKWHHYVFRMGHKIRVRDVEVYQDGVMLTHEAHRFYHNTLIKTRPCGNVFIGSVDWPGADQYMKGQMDDVAIYDRALSLEEILELYKAPDPNNKSSIIKWLLFLLAFIVFILLVTLIIQWRVKKLIAAEKEKNKLQNFWYEQENRVLKAQMDPHFIFNSLNSIQQFIIVNDNEKAQLYLSTFAQLIRMQLESNINETITLAQEIEILEKYLEIESLRFNNVFDYEITFDKTIDLHSVYIPCFILQPFIENAIHHGLLPKIGYKELTIKFEIEDSRTFVCTIEDNGIGRKNSKASESVYKKKSLGVTFVQQRLDIMSKLEKKNYYVEITDKTDSLNSSSGTLVLIKMPIHNK